MLLAGLSIDPFLQQSLRAIDFLMSVQNQDGGIPATVRGDPSGPWTTAMAVEMACQNLFFPFKYFGQIAKCAEFILHTQRTDGSWPVVPAGQASTMATGQCMSALISTRSNPALAERLGAATLDTAINQARNWIINTQNRDGSWGPEPKKSSGKSARTIAVFYALYGLLNARALQGEITPAVRRAIEWCENIQCADGGWPDQPNQPSTLGSTARIATILSRVGDDRTVDRVNRAYEYLKTRRMHWQMATETFVSEVAPGQTIFHFNTLCDILHFLNTRSDPWSQEQALLIVSRAFAVQSNNGEWVLFDFDRTDANVTTWSSAEWVDVLLKRLLLNPASLSITAASVLSLKRQNRFYLFVVSTLVVLLAFGPLATFAELISKSFEVMWGQWSSSTRVFIALVGFIIPAILLSVVSNLLTPFAQGVWENFRRRK